MTVKGIPLGPTAISMVNTLGSQLSHYYDYTVLNGEQDAGKNTLRLGTVTP